jgi:hypothetical protein
MKQIQDNSELYSYLRGLETKFRIAGSTGLADTLALASRHAGGMSTEFLGESRIALRKISDPARALLSEGELSDLRSVLDQLDIALDRR